MKEDAKKKEGKENIESIFKVLGIDNNDVDDETEDAKNSEDYKLLENEIQSRDAVISSLICQSAFLKKLKNDLKVKILAKKIEQGIGTVENLTEEEQEDWEANKMKFEVEKDLKAKYEEEMKLLNTQKEFEEYACVTWG